MEMHEDSFVGIKLHNGAFNFKSFIIHGCIINFGGRSSNDNSIQVKPSVMMSYSFKAILHFNYSTVYGR